MEDADTIKKKTRMLDHDRQKYLQSVQQQMVKQNDTISSLKKENDKFKQELAGTLGGAFKFTEQDKQAQQQQDVETLERRVNFEKMRQADLDKNLTVARMDLARARKTLGGVNAPQDNAQAVEKQVRVLENRLDQALVQFNEALAFNRELRETIDNLRGERKVFTEIYKKLEGELHEKKKAMADVIEKSNRDYEERDALQAQLESLKGAAREDSKKYEEHFSRLDEMMVKYKAAREAQHQQQLMQQAQQQSLKSPTLKSPKGGESFLDREVSAKKGAKAMQSPTDTMRRSDDGEAEEEDVDLQDVVDQLKEATGMQDLDMLHQKFVKEEESNFSLFNFVNELNAEADSLEAEISVLREELGAEQGDVERSQTLKRLEHELAAIETQHDGVVERSQQNKETLDLVRQVAKDIFVKIGCSTEMAEEVCGTAECTELNMLQYFGLIEHRTNELLFRYNQSTALELRRRAAGEEEEVRQRRARQQAERQARIDAGETLNDTDDDDEDDAQPRSLPPQRAQFVGVGPALDHGALTAHMLVMKEGALPTTNTGDTGTGDHDDVEEDAVLDHHVLRQQMEERLRAKREKEEKAGKKGRRGGKK